MPDDIKPAPQVEIEGGPLAITAISRGFAASTDIALTRRFCEEFLGLECVRTAPDRLLAREKPKAQRGEPYWVIEFRLIDDVDTPQGVLNHWGVDVESEADVDRIRILAETHKEYFGIKIIQKARPQHGTYAFLLKDRDSNWWEIEYTTKTRAAVVAWGDIIPLD